MELQQTLVPCIVCGKQLDNLDRDGENQPSDGTAFSSPGHYGSTAFDPLNASLLEINFCDGCLRAAAAQQRVLWRREAKALVGAPPWRNAIFGWVEDTGPYELWDADAPRFSELERQHVESRAALDELIEQRGSRTYGAVKLNGSFTPETVWTEAMFYDEAEA